MDKGISILMQNVMVIVRLFVFCVFSPREADPAREQVEHPRHSRQVQSGPLPSLRLPLTAGRHRWRGRRYCWWSRADPLLYRLCRQPSRDRLHCSQGQLADIQVPI